MYDFLAPECLDRWLASFDDFRVDFVKTCQFLCKAVGYYFTFDQQLLKDAHEKWAAEEKYWRSVLLSQESNELSHLKLFALLLVCLAESDWISEIFEFDTAADARHLEFNGTEDERIEVRKDIAGGRGVYLAFYFCILVINWFENARDDKLQPFEIRITPDLEHDILVYLSSDYRNTMGMFLILKALYVRDDKPGFDAE